MSKIYIRDYICPMTCKSDKNLLRYVINFFPVIYHIIYYIIYQSLCLVINIAKASFFPPRTIFTRSASGVSKYFTSRYAAAIQAQSTSCKNYSYTFIWAVQLKFAGVFVKIVCLSYYYTLLNFTCLIIRCILKSSTVFMTGRSISVKSDI